MTSQCSVTLVVNKMSTLQAYLANSSYTGTVVSPSWCKEFVLRCYPCLTVKVVHVAFQSNYWASLWVTRGPYPTDKPLIRLFCSYFYSRFTRISYNSTGCAIYSTRGRFRFHHSQNRKLHTLPPPSGSAIRNDVIMCFWYMVLCKVTHCAGRV